MHREPSVNSNSTIISQATELKRIIAFFHHHPGRFQVDEHRPQGQYRRHIQNHVAQCQQPALMSGRINGQKTRNCNHLESGFYLANVGHGYLGSLSKLRHPLPQSRDHDLPTNDDAGR